MIIDYRHRLYTIDYGNNNSTKYVRKLEADSKKTISILIINNRKTNSRKAQLIWIFSNNVLCSIIVLRKYHGCDLFKHFDENRFRGSTEIALLLPVGDLAHTYTHTHIRTHMLTRFIVFTVSILEFNNLDTKIDGKNISRELL